MSPIGSYTLASVNGRDVPAVWRQVRASNGDRIRSFWTGGSLVLRPEGSYTVTLRSALEVGERADPLGAVAAEGTWREADDGYLELQSGRGAASRWQASSDHTVLVGRAVHRRTSGVAGRTIFVFLRD